LQQKLRYGVNLSFTGKPIAVLVLSVVTAPKQTALDSCLGADMNNTDSNSRSARPADWPFLDEGAAAKPEQKAGLNVAAHVKKLCDVRMQLFDGLIHDAPFNILLDLFIRETRHEKVTVGDAVLASGTPQTTALRAIHNLIDIGDVVASEDPLDSRRKILHLTPHAQQLMQDFLNKAERLLGG
jgi:hypothetical protein